MVDLHRRVGELPRFQRQEHIMGVPREDGRITGPLWAHYRPKDNPDSVIIQHPKTHEAVACRSTLATADR